MSKCEQSFGALLTIFLLAMAVALPARGQDKYHLGKKATPAEIAGWNIDVRPDGAGLPDGQGSVSQV